MVTTIDIDAVRERIASIPDPEIPVITIDDLGILRGVAVEDDTIVVTITPTYSGCPAMGQIAQDIETAASAFGEVRIDTVYLPAWTTDWISAKGRAALHGYGIAPPAASGATAPVHCPRCASDDTTVVSQFGSTACKALMVCEACREPFDLFKTL